MRVLEYGIAILITVYTSKLGSFILPFTDSAPAILHAENCRSDIRIPELFDRSIVGNVLRRILVE